MGTLTADEPSVQHEFNRSIARNTGSLAGMFAVLSLLHAGIHVATGSGGGASRVLQLDLATAILFAFLLLRVRYRPIPPELAPASLAAIILYGFVDISFHRWVQTAESQVPLLLLVALMGIALLPPRWFVGLAASVLGLGLWIESQLAHSMQPLQLRVFALLATGGVSIYIYRTRRRRQLRFETLLRQEAEAREHYRLLAENSLDIIWTMDAEGRITYMSPSEERLLGYRPEERVGEPATKAALTEESLQVALGYFAQVVSGDLDAICFEAEHVRKDGSTVWCEINAQAVRDDDGNLEAIHASTRDISDRREAAEALRESEARYRLLAERSLDPIMEFDPDGTMVYASPAAEKTWGLPIDALVGNHWTFAMSKESLPVAEEVVQAFRGGSDEPAQIELRHHLADGSDLWSDLRVWPVRDADGKLESVQFMARDVTERKQTAALLERQRQRLAERADQLTRLNEQLEAFSSTVSHDLQAPLRRIRRRLEGAREPGNQPSEHLAQIEREIGEMSELVEHLLETSRSYEQALEITDVDLGELVRRVVVSCGLETGRQCELDAPPKRTVFVRADERLLGMVVTNLVQNSFKFAPPAQNPLRLRFEEDRSGDEPVYSLSDNGRGFAAPDPDKLFEPFTRGAAGDRSPGHGIGLATVKRIVELHGGRVWATNDDTGGAVVRFTLGQSEAPSAQQGAAW